MIEEKVIIGEGSKYPLNGILMIPEQTERPVPAVVLVHGSGPVDMNEKIGNNYPFKDIADGLSEKGIAVIRYDKRTFVYGKEIREDSSLSVKEEVIEDVIFAADILRKDARIDSERIFIIGHSMGGMLAPRIDDEGGNFAGIVILGGSPRNLNEIIMDQNYDVLNSLGKFLQWIGKKQIKKLASKFEAIDQLSDEEAKKTLLLGKYVRSYYFKEMIAHPSIDYLKVLNKPILILQGDKDFQVTVERDFNLYKELLNEKQNVTFKLYPNLNHLFMPSVYGNISKAKKEYKVAQHVDGQVIADIAEWIVSI